MSLLEELLKLPAPSVPDPHSQVNFEALQRRVLKLEEIANSTYPQINNLGKTNAFTYGHSYLTNVGGAHTPGKRWLDLIVAKYGIESLNELAVGGERAVQTLGRILNGFPSGETGVVFLENMINDIRLMGNGLGLSTYKQVLRASFAALSAARKFDFAAGNFTVTKVWNFGELAQAYKTKVAFTSEKEATATTGFRGTEATLILWGLAKTFGGGTAKVYIDGTLFQTVSLKEIAPKDEATGVQFAPVAVRATGLENKLHTLKIEATEAATIYVDCVLSPSVRPPLIIMVKDPKLYEWNAFPTYNKGSDAVREEYSKAVDEVAAEFPNVIVVDGNRKWIPKEMITDKVHPNDKGHAQMAEDVEFYLRGLSTADNVFDRMGTEEGTRPTAKFRNAAELEVPKEGALTAIPGLATTLYNIGWEYWEVSGAKLIFLKEGTYKLGTGVQWTAVPGGKRRLLFIRKNGATTVAAVTGDELNEGAAFQTLLAEEHFVVGDYIEVLVNQTEAAAVKIANNQASQYLSVSYQGP